MNRLPTFEANIKAPVRRAIEDNRSIEDIAGIIEEIELFACPVCGHIMVDHSWVRDPASCLVKVDFTNRCPCPGPEFVEFDHDELVAEIGNIIRAA